AMTAHYRATTRPPGLTPVHHTPGRNSSIFAEVERNTIKERTTSARKKLRAESRWAGETVHYGLKPQKLPDGGWKLVHDAEAVQVIRRIVADVMRGDSVQSIAGKLTAEGVPSSRDRQRQLQGKPTTGAAWSTTTLHRLLESKTLLGYTVHQGDADPEVMKSEPILTASEFRSLQAALELRKRPKTTNRTGNASPLLGVAFCLECQSPMHQKSQVAKGKRYRYYYCSDKPQHGNKIPGEWLESVLEETFLDELGDIEVHEPVIIPASDHTDELESARMRLEVVTEAMRKATSLTVLETLAEQIAELDSRIGELESLPVEAARTEHVPTGRTYAEDWENSDTEARRRLLLDSGIRYEVLLEGRTRAANQGGAFKSNLFVPQDIRDRMATRKGTR
ncbi:recombinase family protein, partial [Mycobacterium sp. DSM 3803]|nr:recombinase family protein [Mycobacterium sp. DSM 3803]